MTEKKQQPHQDDKDNSLDGELPPWVDHRNCIATKGLKDEGGKRPTSGIFNVLFALLTAE